MDAQARQQARLEEIRLKKARLEELKRNRQLKDQEIQKNRISLTDRSDVCSAYSSPCSQSADIARYMLHLPVELIVKEKSTTSCKA